MRYSRFGRRRPFIRTSGVDLMEANFFNLKGLNLYSPDELLKNEETPFARNFRVFQSDDEQSRVCISKRNGREFYTVPIGETNRGEITSTTDADKQPITNIIRYAQPFTVSAGGRLTKIDLKLERDGGTAPLRIDIYSDDSGPQSLIASSSFSQADIPESEDYISARFIEAPLVETDTTYWFVVWRQEEYTGEYTIASNTSATTALKSENAGNSWETTDYCLNYKVYVSTDAQIKGYFRYYKSTAPTTPTTLLVVGTDLYSVNDTTGATTSISSAFNANATNYRFASTEDKVYIVNGFDDPKIWDGTTLTTATGAAAQFTAISGASARAIDVAVHKQRLWYLLDDNNITYSDDLDFDTFGSSLNFIYAPSPKHPDKAKRFIPYQDNLIVFTEHGKWVIYGSDRQTIQIRESTSIKGLASPNALMKYGDYLYFLSDDDIYYFNGGNDTGMGIKIDQVFDNMATKRTAGLCIHNNLLKVYYTPEGEGFNSKCLVCDMNHKEWAIDDKIFTKTGIVFGNQTDESVLIEASSLVGALYYGEKGTSDLGRGIEFEYRTKYFSWEHPANKHRIKRLYPFFRPGTSNYSVDVQVDIDEINSPRSNFIYLGTPGAVWDGDDEWDSDAEWDSGTLRPKRISIPGRARKHQIRFVQYGVDNHIEIVGYTVFYKTGRLI